MTKITAIDSFKYLGQRLTFTDPQGTVVIGVLEYVSAAYLPREPARMMLTIGGHDIETHAAWESIEVDSAAPA